MRNQRGISLVELMVSITVGLILMTGVVQLFLSSRATFTTQQAISRVQETGRLAMEFMSRDIRMAGYMGCMSRNLNFTNTLNNSNALAYSFDVGIQGLDNYASAVTGYPAARIGTDILVVRSANGLGVGVTQNNDSSQLFAQDTGTDPNGCGAGEPSLSGLCIGDVLVVADCMKARIFQATNLQDTGGISINVVHSGNASGGTFEPGNAISSWGGASGDPSEQFGPDSQIIKIQTTSYYVADGTSGRPSLWQRVGTQDPLELLEGVEDMQLTYGRDTTGDSIPDSYVTAAVLNTANDWDSVLSVRVELLVSSTDDNVLQEAQAYTFNGTTVNNPGDRRLRQVFNSTVGIRSRLP
ncbi:PilW family protein [Microbulbifer yueqingensis]|uniref:Type IV pilus assembly protein PilW n=1 Tax=Microbulbifer yueqingensis TaxID=658219 RepID=A0A1G9EW02_9GAMM|nr:PilW family protein [Microbulbifer yueqingensis]SDK80304.1 type IV pilus assembly protein PilW [Microbulbifer yueqingensis]